MLSDFKTPLPRLLASTLSSALNEMVSLDETTDCSDRLGALEGRIVALSLVGLGMTLTCQVNHGRFTIEAIHPSAFRPEHVDTFIEGSPSSLLALAIPDWAGPKSDVRIQGDATAAQAFERFMRQLNPDWERMLVDRLGVVVGHQVFQVLKGTWEVSQQVAEVGAEQVGHYIREESPWVVNRSDWNDWVRQLDELSEGIDRLEVNARRGGLL